MIDLLENMDKGLTVPKWVLINWPKIPKIPPNISLHIVFRKVFTLLLHYIKGGGKRE